MASTTFNKEFVITDLQGAEYNPRRISKEDLETLRVSVTTLGIVKPIITNGTTIVAGHQRTKALLAQGIKHAPVLSLDVLVNTYDEVRFNQLHNGTDMDCGEEECKVDMTGLDYKVRDFVEIEPSRLTGNLRCRYATLRREISRLISQYGAWGACVVTESGDVIHAAQYALSCIITETPLLAYVIKDDEVELYQGFLNKSYGVFTYDHLEKDTYIQTLAQMMRLRSDNGAKKENKSNLYEGFVIPTISKEMRVLDFGSGQGDYAKRLRNEGYNISDIELFRRNGAGNTFNMRAINRMITNFVSDYKQNGKLDAVVCDSVMNSVDCDKAELSILDFLNFVVKDGGTLYISGRARTFIESLMRTTKHSGITRGIEFLDEKGYSAMYRKGHWFYQKFHREEQFRLALKESGFKCVDFKTSNSSWQCVAVKETQVSDERAAAAIEYEFNLPISKTDTINRHKDVLEIIKVATKEVSDE